MAQAFGERNGLPVYRVGVYGSGAVCQAVLDAGLAELAWLSCSSGWSGYKNFLASGRWNLRQYTPRLVAGLDADPNDANPQRGDIGDFVPGAAAPMPEPPQPSEPPPVPVDNQRSPRGSGWLAVLLELLRRALGR